MNVAFIPVRGGSKSIPYKNIRPIAGHPLVYWVTKAASECPEIDRVYVATDDEKIRQVVESFKFDKVIVIDRGEETATDTASTESAMLEFAANYDFDNIVLIQATSPLLEAADISNGFDILSADTIDSVLSVVEQKRFIWKYTDSKKAEPINYDVYARPRRQDFNGYLVENGAFYITSKEKLLKSKNRVSGNIGVVEMSPLTYLEIDEPTDWTVIELQLSERVANQQKEFPSIKKFKMFISDCDGCLTDGGMYYSENGDELKKFNTRDGVAFGMLKEKGIIICILTGEDRNLNRRRAEKLKIDELISGSKNKLSDVKSLCNKYDISPREVIYVGDDINDYEAMQYVGFCCAPADSAESIKKIANYTTARRGGEGVIREIVDKLIKNEI